MKFLLSALIFPFFLFSQPIHTDLLVVLQDAGETYAILPVLDELEKEGVQYQVIAGGVAESIFEAQEKPFISYSDLGFSYDVGKTSARASLFTDFDLQKIAQNIAPKVVLTGVAFQFQAQVLSHFRNCGIETISYWDNFSPIGTDPYFETAHLVYSCADHVFVPSSTFFSYLKGECTVVGQPSLEVWKNKLEDCDREQIYNRLNLPRHTNFHSFIGGYGKEYEEGLSLFIKCASLLDPTSEFTLIQPHPKTDGSLERVLSQAYPHIRVLNGEVSTIELVSVSDFLYTHQSSVGFQALSANKQVSYIIPPHQNYTNPAIEAQIARKVSTIDEFFSQEKNCSLDFFEVFQVPKNPIYRMKNEILELMKKSPLHHKVESTENGTSKCISAPSL